MMQPTDIQINMAVQVLRSASPDFMVMFDALAPHEQIKLGTSLAYGVLNAEALSSSATRIEEQREVVELTAEELGLEIDSWKDDGNKACAFIKGLWRIKHDVESTNIKAGTIGPLWMVWSRVDYEDHTVESGQILFVASYAEIDKPDFEAMPGEDYEGPLFVLVERDNLEQLEI